ncbi:hypothetical protein DINM_003269 [Dirofilaria immitis]|nr:hypothetical protein [Dirofilaria immitis]
MDEVAAGVNVRDPLKGSISSVHQKVIGYLIPRLKDCATGRDLVSHRKAQSGKYYKEDDDIQRAPVALATVKLLQKMPQKIMDCNLPGVIIKMCSLLMSRSTVVREAAGKTVIEIAKILGPKYIRFIVQEMKQTMRKGYQLHVMIFYVHKLLSAMEEQLHAGDLDSCLMDIVDVCVMDLFGSTAEEKAITGITKDVPEAKTQRAYETYRLLGRYISSQCLGSVLILLKKVVESTPDAKTMRKMSRSLWQYSLGISANEELNLQLHCIGAVVKVSAKSKMHIFVEFGLSELYLVLKKKVFDVESKDDVARLDPFVDIIFQCLKLEYDKILVNSLRCFLILLRFPLPSLRSTMTQFLNRLFILLSNYVTSDTTGNAQGCARKSVEVSQLVFKAVTQIVKDAPCLVLTSKRLQLLLTYVETDIADSQKQAVAFPLIKAIIIRKLQDSKIIEIIQYLMETAIVSEVSHIREQCRQNLILLETTINHFQSRKGESRCWGSGHNVWLCNNRDRKPHANTNFYAHSILKNIMNATRKAKLGPDAKSQITLVITLFVGNHPQCKKPSKYIEFFLEQLDYKYEDGRKSAIEILNIFFEKLAKEINDDYALLAFVKLAARLINDESSECRQMVMLAIQKLLEVYICIAIQVLVIFNKLGGEKVGNILRELLFTLSKIVHADILYSYAEEKEMGPLAQCSKSPTVQLSAARFLGSLFSILNKEYLLSQSNPSPRVFMQWTLAQMKTYKLSNELAEQIAKNLVYLFDVVSQSDEDLQWLCHRLSVLCNFELVKLPNETVRRITVFKVMAVIVLKVDPERTDVIIQSLLSSLYHTEILQKIAIEVAESIKRKIGDEEFTKRMAECSKLYAAKLEGRKRKQKEEAVLDPTSAARKNFEKIN